MAHFAIIRNAKYKLANLQSVSRHNERQNAEYGNKDIDTSRSGDNYRLKSPREKSYEKEFFRLREENGLKGNLRLSGKKQSNVVCEFLITSDAEYFKGVGGEETRRFFQEAYGFACGKCGERNIVSAVVHMDETTPHMHLTYIPVVNGLKKGREVEKINCSEFWKGHDSYGRLQDEFHAHMAAAGFALERGVRNADREESRGHLAVEEFKIASARQEASELRQSVSEMQGGVIALEKQKNALEGEIRALQDARDVISGAMVDEYAEGAKTHSMEVWKARIAESKQRASDSKLLELLKKFVDLPMIKPLWEKFVQSQSMEKGRDGRGDRNRER